MVQDNTQNVVYFSSFIFSAHAVGKMTLEPGMYVSIFCAYFLKQNACFSAQMPAEQAA
jgi:hypothetical protein